jgi:hypothetical protein
VSCVIAVLPSINVEQRKVSAYLKSDSMPLTCSMETLSQSMHDGYTGPGFIPSVKLQFSVSELPYTKEFENIKSKLRCSEHRGESTFCWVDTSQNGAPHYPMCTQDLQEWARYLVRVYFVVCKFMLIKISARLKILTIRATLCLIHFISMKFERYVRHELRHRHSYVYPPSPSFTTTFASRRMLSATG